MTFILTIHLFTHPLPIESLLLSHHRRKPYHEKYQFRTTGPVPSLPKRRGRPNIFCRLADGDKHLKPTTSRPMYMSVVGRLVVSGRKRLLRLTSTHLKASEIQSSLMQIGEFMKRISANAEQLDFNRIWEIIILAAFRKWLCGNKTKGLLPLLLTLIN